MFFKLFLSVFSIFLRRRWQKTLVPRKTGFLKKSKYNKRRNNKAHKYSKHLFDMKQICYNNKLHLLYWFIWIALQPSQLEHLCINLCAETMQHFYNTHIFKSSIESCRDEGIHCDVEVDYVDNVPCIDLISSLVSFYLFI